MTRTFHRLLSSPPLVADVIARLGVALALAMAALLALATAPSAQTLAPPSGLAATAETPRVLIAARTMKAGEVLRDIDLAFRPATGADAPGSYIDTLDAAVGLETRVAVYQGRPIRAGDLRAPTVVRRNAIVTLTFERAGLSIQTEGRALEDGGLGERIRVMNLDSRRTVTGSVAGPQLVVMQ